MQTIPISTQKPYSVYIGEGILKDIPSLLQQKTVAIISDSNVWPLYGSMLKSTLEQSGVRVFDFQFPAGENSKNADTYLEILNFLSLNHITRADAIVALGGGVVGDVAGFVAATYLRGIAYIQVPTTLLAMVDSSVGGKTAINLPSGKNLAGAFYQPSLVLCDLDLLSTLPMDNFRDGCGEVIKYGILYDPMLFSHLKEQGLNFDREYVICRCIELKAQVVTVDETDKGIRQKLNFGHTIGHSIEKASHYAVSHGNAVATGIALVTQASFHLGYCAKQTLDSVLAVLKVFGLPTATTFSPDVLTEVAKSDKKFLSDTVNLIIPKEIGNCVIAPTPIASLQSFIEAGFSK